MDTDPSKPELTPKERRIEIIKELEKVRGTRVICFVTSTRDGLDFPIAMDSIRKLFEHLKDIDTTEELPKIDLFIHSNGGDSIVPWKLVTLVRDYCSEFNLIVPHRAFSAGTLIALGADQIIMHPMGMLGPTDPTVKNQYNPQNPRNANELLGISVEDVTSYIKLIKEDFGITHEDELIEAVKILAEKVHPLALGNVKRFHSQSRMLAKKLLELHMKDEDDNHKISEIVDNLNSKLFFHGHPIHYKEAQKLGLKVDLPEKSLQDLIWKLYLSYEQEMSLDTEFRFMDYFLSQQPVLGVGQSKIVPLPLVKGVYIESTKKTDVRTANFKVIGVNQNGIVNAQLITDRIGWQEE